MNFENIVHFYNNSIKLVLRLKNVINAWYLFVILIVSKQIAKIVVFFLNLTLHFELRPKESITNSMETASVTLLYSCN